jgi:hypothetical protein
MHALLLATLLLTAGDSQVSDDPLTQAAPNESSSIHDALEAVVQKRVKDPALEDSTLFVNDLVISKASRWLHVDYVELDREIAAASALAHRKDKPKLLLLIAEQNLEMPQPYTWWHRAAGGPARTDTCESRMMEKLGVSGWVFVEHSTVEQLPALQKLTADLSDSDAIALCKDGGGDRVVVGQVTAASPGESEMAPAMVAAHANMSLHLIDCKSGRTLRRIDQSVGDISTLDSSLSAAGTKALRIAGTRLADIVQTEILEKMPPL